MNFKIKKEYIYKVQTLLKTNEMYVNIDDIKILMDNNMLHTVDYNNVYKNKQEK